MQSMFKFSKRLLLAIVLCLLSSCGQGLYQGVDETTGLKVKVSTRIVDTSDPFSGTGPQPGDGEFFERATFLLPDLTTLSNDTGTLSESDSQKLKQLYPNTPNLTSSRLRVGFHDDPVDPRLLVGNTLELSNAGISISLERTQ